MTDMSPGMTCGTGGPAFRHRTHPYGCSQEVPGLVPNQSIAGIGDPFVWSAADPTLLLLQETIHHFSNGQDVYRLSTV